MLQFSNYLLEKISDCWTFFPEMLLDVLLRFFFNYFLWLLLIIKKHSKKQKILLQSFLIMQSWNEESGTNNQTRHETTAKFFWACRHMNSRGGISPWNEDGDQFQFRATSKTVNAAALTGMLEVRDTGWGI